MSEKPLIIVSATRFFQSGSIVIVNDCLCFLSGYLSDKYRIKALVYKKELYAVLPNIEFIEFPKSRKNIFYRLYYEYFYFHRFSKKYQPHLWFSMQDSTPIVNAAIQTLYFHNSLLLYPKPLALLRLQPRIFFLWFLYKTIYTRRIRKNDFISVQQNTLSGFLRTRFHVPENRLLVFPPRIKDYPVLPEKQAETFLFIFPSTSFAYKNYEVLFKACAILRKQSRGFKIMLTASGNENNYIRRLKKQYKFSEIEYAGFLNRHDLFTLYNYSDCMVFPSLVESWGLPLSEFALQNKPVICADLPYAKETLHNYTKVKFFNPYNASQLAGYMLDAINGKLSYDKNDFHYSQPVIENWKELFDVFLTAKS